MSEQPIGTSDGDALLAVIAVGLVGPPDGLDGVLKTVSHEPELRQLYDELLKLVLDPYPATRQMSHRLAELQRLPMPTVAWRHPREQLNVDYEEGSRCQRSTTTRGTRCDTAERASTASACTM